MINNRLHVIMKRGVSADIFDDDPAQAMSHEDDRILEIVRSFDPFCQQRMPGQDTRPRCLDFFLA
jgi:hypothetical protein